MAWFYINICMSPLKKILIVDDEEDLCLLMKIYFTRKMYEVNIANTLTDGLRQLEKWHPDILFLDNNLPDGLGWEKAPELLDHYPELIIHLISAFHPNIPEHHEKDRLRVIEKPFSQQQLNALNI
jgi:DNA-binding NtrC family response regulator